MQLLDTNIVSELIRIRPDPAVLAWSLVAPEFAVSAMTVEEMNFGLARRPNARIASWLQGFLERHPVLPITHEIARRAGELRGSFAGRGIVRSQADMLIAATAQAHALTLVTRNTGDFAGCGIPVLNPFGA
jgi:predicted nucleic acid-binding protein